jgi:hypothetical protein
MVWILRVFRVFRGSRNYLGGDWGIPLSKGGPRDYIDTMKEFCLANFLNAS